MHRSHFGNNPTSRHEGEGLNGRTESLTPGCIGRETELKQLLRAYETGKKRGGHSLFLCGPKGVGKSSIFQELKRRLRSSGIGVMEVFCRQGTAPFETTAALVRQASIYLEESAPHAFENSQGFEVSRLAASLQSIGFSNTLHSETAGTTKECSGGGFVDGSTDLFETAVRFLMFASEVSPPAIIFHDLDRAGSSVVREIERLVAALSLPCVKNFSEPDKDPFFRGFFLFSVGTELEEVTVRDLPFWVGGVSHEIMKLGGLEKDGVAAFLRSEAAVERFTRLTGGNPRNLKSLLTWGSPDADEVIRSRLIPISDDARALASCCALADRPVGPALLKRLTRFNSKRIGSSIEELLSSGLMKHSIVTGELQISFCNSGDQDTVIEATPPEDLRKWRMRIAEVLLEDGDRVSAVEQILSAAVGAPPEFRAQHHQTLKQFYEFVMDAGNMLEVSGDSDRAAKIYERTLDTLPVTGPFTEGADALEGVNDVCMRLAGILELQGRYSDAIRILENARKSDPENLEFGRLYGRLLCLKGLGAEAEHCLSAGKKSAREMKDPFMEAQFSAELCEVYFRKGSHSEVESECIHANNLVDKCSPSAACDELRSMLSLVAGKTALEEGEIQAASQHFNEALSRARAGSSVRQEIRSLINMGICHLKKGEHAQARSFYSNALDASVSGQDIGHQAFCLQNLAVLSHWRRDFETALRRFHEAVAVFQRMGNTTILALLALDLGELYLQLGDNGRSAAMLQLSRDLSPDPAHGSLEIFRSLLDGRIALDSGLFLKAKQQFLRARKAAQQSERHEDAAIAAIELARMELSLGNPEAANEIMLDMGVPATPKLNALKLRLESELEYETEGKYSRTKLLKTLQLFELVEDPDGLWKTQVLLFDEALKSGNRAEAAKWKRTAKRTESKIRSTVPDEFLESYLHSAARRPYLERIGAVEPDSFDTTIHNTTLSSEAVLPARKDEDSAGAEISQKASEAIAAMVGKNKNFLGVVTALKKVAAIDSTVLLRGESGTGKELAARAIHLLSDRADKPLVGVNCGALVETLLLSELFGHERGAFTGATRCKKGRFEVAEGGTLFLDEIGDISQRTQVALLRVLQEKCFERVGGTESIKADVRIVLATNRNLEQMVKDGTFREDLYYRIKTLEIELPPLRQRGEDVILIAREICRKIGAHERGGLKTLSPEAENLLLSHPWYGNVRELENVLRSCWIFCEGNKIPGSLVSKFINRTMESEKTEHLKHEPENKEEEIHNDHKDEHNPGAESADWFAVMQDEGISLKDMKKRIELECIQKALERSDGNITQAAGLLGMKRPRLSQLVKEYGLNGQ